MNEMPTLASPALVARMKEAAVRYHEASTTQIGFTEYKYARLDFEAIATPAAVLALISAYEAEKERADLTNRARPRLSKPAGSGNQRHKKEQKGCMI